jgi:hypothetical protein
MNMQAPVVVILTGQTREYNFCFCSNACVSDCTAVLNGHTSINPYPANVENRVS